MATAKNAFFFSVHRSDLTIVQLTNENLLHGDFTHKLLSLYLSPKPFLVKDTQLTIKNACFLAKMVIMATKNAYN